MGKIAVALGGKGWSISEECIAAELRGSLLSYDIDADFDRHGPVLLVANDLDDCVDFSVVAVEEFFEFVTRASACYPGGGGGAAGAQETDGDDEKNDDDEDCGGLLVIF